MIHYKITKNKCKIIHRYKIKTYKHTVNKIYALQRNRNIGLTQDDVTSIIF
jgi:hypothetical protein